MTTTVAVGKSSFFFFNARNSNSRDLFLDTHVELRGKAHTRAVDLSKDIGVMAVGGIGKHEISAMTEDELAVFRQQHLGFIFQSYNLLGSLTALENVALPLMFKGVPKAQR